MNKFSFFNISERNKLVDLRVGEIKFGERINFIDSSENIDSFLSQTESKYIIFGICESIGVKANFGRTGTENTWQIALKSLLNIQHNKTCKANHVGVLGYFNFEEENELAKTLNPSIKEDRKQLFKLVEKIDKEIAFLVSKIIKSNKIPIIIGGGHNNAYGNIKGLALAKGRAVNVINFDAHTDFRPLEGRHSGNGFSYAFEEDFLRNYFIFGIHENYTSKEIFSRIKENDQRVKFNTYEQMEIRLEKDFRMELKYAARHIKDNSFGIELDLDAIIQMPSSAMTYSGFSTKKARQFVSYFANLENVSYLHICEGAPNFELEENKAVLGKFISYLITDFIKPNLEVIE
ncbi:arginase [Paenimyroides tangerinum]|uniref:Arginase n=1 Tax=Paenimyroides tangerinum TaxID=2488728 RepID=A0A3P3VZR3_9FLAO|nr:formimidoylglutamase [Paenimyroides tangerinum]RRJ87737.1 arginase [Paenimyroides tangerinum]